jgi:hypothetical protein
MAIVDLDIYGRVNTDGSPVTHTGDMAISNALVAYLTSRKGDYINDPNFGGPMEFLMFKQLNQDTIVIEDKLTSEITSVFGRILSLDVVSVEPDYEGRQWVVDIFYTSKSTGAVNQVKYFANTTASSFVPVQRFKSNVFIDVPYADENLKNFVLLKQGEIPNEKIVKNDTDGIFYWGYYRLVNFNESDPLFTEITTLVNGA